jgi:hypothetical protein
MREVKKSRREDCIRFRDMISVSKGYLLVDSNCCQADWFSSSASAVDSEPHCDQNIEHIINPLNNLKTTQFNVHINCYFSRVITIPAMASLPSQSSWRPSSRSEESSSEATETPSAGLSQPESSSESFVLNNPQTTAFPGSSAAQDMAIPPATTSKEGLPVRLCWICQQESSDDKPGTEWRTPCPCSLTAHNECLLEWITSEEAPKPGEIGTSKEIKCPQCQATINIQRPRDYIVLAAGKIQTLAKGLVIPTALSAIASCFYSGLLVYGVNTIHVVFGAEEALSMTVPANNLSFLTRHAEKASRLIKKILTTSDPFMPTLPDMPNWKLYLGLPMIAPTLILVRTTVADQVFAVLPLCVCAISIL